VSNANRARPERARHAVVQMRKTGARCLMRLNSMMLLHEIDRDMDTTYTLSTHCRKCVLKITEVHTSRLEPTAICSNISRTAGRVVRRPAGAYQFSRRSSWNRESLGPGRSRFKTRMWKKQLPKAELPAEDQGRRKVRCSRGRGESIAGWDDDTRAAISRGALRKSGAATIRDGRGKLKLSGNGTDCES